MPDSGPPFACQDLPEGYVPSTLLVLLERVTAPSCCAVKLTFLSESWHLPEDAIFLSL